MQSYERITRAFDRACQAAGVGYALIGGMAVNAWGNGRSSFDIDVLLALEPSRIPTFVDALAREGLRGSAMDLEDALRDRSHVTIDVPWDVLHVDIKLARTLEERAQIRDAIDLEVEDYHLRVARPEDTIVFKLKFGSPRDIEDAKGILDRQRSRLDMARLRSLAGRVGVADDLERLLKGLALPEEGPGGRS